jgi:hypothetical protein
VESEGQAFEEGIVDSDAAGGSECCGEEEDVLDMRVVPHLPESDGEEGASMVHSLVRAAVIRQARRFLGSSKLLLEHVFFETTRAILK